MSRCSLQIDARVAFACRSEANDAVVAVTRLTPPVEVRRGQIHRPIRTDDHVPDPTELSGVEPLLAKQLTVRSEIEPANALILECPEQQIAFPLGNEVRLVDRAARRSDGRRVVRQAGTRRLGPP